MSFAFVGKLAASKSILNRLLLVQSYFPELTIQGDSSCEDVAFMKLALQALKEGQEIPVGAAGTVLRFMALRASRIPGQHRLIGHPSLFARPQNELLQILNQVGVQAQLHERALTMTSQGWKLQGDTLMVSSHRSSQFASSVLLNAWDLPFDLYVSLTGARVSEGYWQMSNKLAQNLGMKMDFWDQDFRVVKDQRINRFEFEAEIDLSSAFAVAAVAAVSGQAKILNFPQASLQPDHMFVSIFRTMGVPIHLDNGTLVVEKTNRLSGISVNLKNAPDLFPVLAALCGLAHGESVLFGAPHLIYKESNRLQHMVDLLKHVGREVVIEQDGLIVRGEPNLQKSRMQFDPQNDHRLAFAAGVLKMAGADIEILNPSVVSKSFPEFWSVCGCNP